MTQTQSFSVCMSGCVRERGQCFYKRPGGRQPSMQRLACTHQTMLVSQDDDSLARLGLWNVQGSHALESLLDFRLTVVNNIPFLTLGCRRQHVCIAKHTRLLRKQPAEHEGDSCTCVSLRSANATTPYLFLDRNPAWRGGCGDLCVSVCLFVYMGGPLQSAHMRRT